jgi:hypothetical protein
MLWRGGATLNPDIISIQFGYQDAPYVFILEGFFAYLVGTYTTNQKREGEIVLFQLPPLPEK